MIGSPWAASPRRRPRPLSVGRRGSRLPWMLAAVLPVAAWFGWQQFGDDDGPTAAASARPPTTAAPTGSEAVEFAAPTGDRSTGPRCSMVMIDESASMSQADAAGTRPAAVRAASDFFAAYGIDGDRIGVMWFADRTEVIDPAPPAELPMAATADLGGGTQLAVAVDAALTSLAANCDGADPVLVIVSDGAASSSNDYTAMATALGNAPDVAVHLIAMNDNGAYSTAQPFWSEPSLGIVSIQPIDSFGSAEVGPAMANVLSTETGQTVTTR